MTAETEIYQYALPKLLLKVIRNHVFLVMILVCINQNVSANTININNKKDSTKQTVSIRVVAGNKDCIFKRKYIRYTINIVNTYKVAQEGKIEYEVSLCKIILLNFQSLSEKNRFEKPHKSFIT